MQKNFRYRKYTYSEVKKIFMLKQCFYNCSFKFFIKTYLRQSWLSNIKRQIFPKKIKQPGKNLSLFDWKLL